jgi:hypothetical protein
VRNGTYPCGVGGLLHLDESSGHTAEDARYLARLDDLLPSALAGLADPSEVGSLWYGGVLVWLTVPSVPDGEMPVINNTLQVSYSAGSLRAYWGCSHLWDDYDEHDPEHLARETGELPPEAVADMAANWLTQQLRRPLVRQEWDRGPLGPAVRWVLADSGTERGGRGWLFRRRHRPPDRTVPLN